MNKWGKRLILIPLVLLGCGPSYPALTMNQEQLRSVSDDTICGTMACSAHLTQAMSLEMKRRGLSCLNITYTCTSSDPSIRTTPGAQLASSGPAIFNSDSPACSGISIVEAGQGMYNGIIPAMYVKVQNTSGQRKWIQADIKYAGETHTALQNTAEQWWETTQPLVTREAGESIFWVRTQPAGMLQVKVIGCG
jgi:hypothetical protein